MVNRFPCWLAGKIFPQSCRLCGLASERDVPLCHACQNALPRNQHHCATCAVPLALAGDESRVCGRCLKQPPAFDRARAPWLYDPQLAALIAAWKYQRDLRLTPLLASLMLAGQTLDTATDLIVAMPLHWRRLMWRGFNQSQELVEAAFGQQLSPSNAPVCKRRMYSPAQSGLGARQRNTLPANAFTVRGRCDNLRVALVDDVMTTGATAHALALKLRAAGASHIEVWCIARTPAPDVRRK